MKLKILLLFISITSALWAQEPYRNLVITEAFMADDYNEVYFEITNVGESGIDLSEIKFAQGWPQMGSPIYDVWNDPWNSNGRYFYLPESVTKILQPGESYVLTITLDFGLNMYNARIPDYGFANRAKKHDIYQYADFLAHRMEKNDDEEVLYPHIKDSITYFGDNPNIYHEVLGYCYLPQIGFYIEHMFAEGDSAVIDQVGNMFDNDGRNSELPQAVAGVENATTSALLIRKNVIKNGNLDFANAKGVGLEDSEWMAINYPTGVDDWRDTWWTVGNHGNYVLDENTLEPELEGMEVDFSGKTITVPWGVRRLDDIMRNMKYKPGVAWVYHLNESAEDSLLRSAQTDDKLTIYVAGNILYMETFDIKVGEPTQNVNIVVPIDHVNRENFQRGGAISENVQHGLLDWPRVTNHKNGQDTITGGGYGLPHALRPDSLLKYLEKPANATWEFVWVDGEKRADLKNGDILKVIAQNGAVKEYYLEVQDYGPSHNANLSSITWPDIPEYYRGIFGWKGDTIPNFNPSSFNYKITVPIDVEGIPALVVKTENLNARVKVKRATTFSGSLADRTVTFTVTAEDDSIVNTYTVELIKEKDPSKLQPYHADPFFSEFSFNSRAFGEIFNPGNQPLDLSNYMIISKPGVDIPGMIKTGLLPTDWPARYNKYIPGFKWQTQVDWAITPGILVQDISVNPIVMPGEVFSMGAINAENTKYLMDVLDVQFFNSTTDPDIKNPWNEEVTGISLPTTFTQNWFLFRILNDSVKLGLKPVNDPNDFELIDAICNVAGGRWYVGGSIWFLWSRLLRKPNVHRGNTAFGGSLGTTPDDTEWIYDRENLHGNLGTHFMNEITFYMSTVNAKAYKVSPGYSMNESIKGIVTGTSAEVFIGNIFKADEGQTLTVKSFADGSELAMKALLSNSDTLVVLSADSVNTTKYVLEVNDKGLSSNAILTSGRYKVTIEQDPKSASKETAEAGVGNIKGFDYGTALRTILANVKVPPGASLAVIDGQGAYVPLKMLNFDTTYVNVTVNDNIYLDVVAENGVTRIIYQLVPEVSDNDAFLTSDVYTVVQKDVLIHYVPRGTSVQAFLANLVPSAGATMKLVDKLGNERTVGSIVQDDKVVVTSPNGLNSRVYFLSMLATQNIKVTTYLAYILSPFYGIDQVAYKVAGVSGAETVSAFLAKVIAAPGATAYVVDKNGAVKTTGDINGSDMVKVVSADGVMNVFYTFGPLTSAGVLEANDIQLYPNPTNGKINVSGVKAGNRIQVYNSLGAMIRDIKVQSTIETISFDNQPAGMYMIVISDQNKMLGRYKALRK
jgi:hypothetical protein